MKIDKNQIIVYGGTGYYGRKVVEKLVKKGQSVKVVSRNSESARKTLGDKVEIFQGDVTNRETIIESLKNVNAIIICLSAMSNKLIKRMKQIERDAVIAIMEEAKKANISRLVYMSGYEMREQLLADLGIPEFGAIKIEIESKISQSDFSWTILGDAPAFEIFFAFIRNGKMTVPGGGFNAIPTISAEDVGEITAQVVMRNDLAGKRIKLTGPEALTFPEVAKRISLISGKKVKHIAIPLAIINVVSFILIPFAPFVRFLYKSLKMLNNFPKDLADKVPEDHKRLRELFDYEPVSLEEEIKRRISENKL
ncbi:MAG: NAD-dependent epimerase/dehydratase family protein [Bacteroidales bacterium]|nr:MAG: NAD-dependent epimerase/dehydratase family protein [Bacteroidales bacterium]